MDGTDEFLTLTPPVASDKIDVTPDREVFATPEAAMGFTEG
jgi:hypothetical protein